MHDNPRNQPASSRSEHDQSDAAREAPKPDHPPNFVGSTGPPRGKAPKLGSPEEARILRRRVKELEALISRAGINDPGEAYKGSLQKKNKSATNSGSMKPGKFEYPQPQTEAEIDGIQQRVSELAHVAHTIASLGVTGVDAAPVQIAGLHEVASRTEKLARDIGLAAIAQGKMSQVQLGRLLGVHQATVSRWVEAAESEQRPPACDKK